MRSPPKAFTKLLLPSVLIMAVAIGAFIWRGLTDQRSFPGHIVRRLNGESGALQELNDIAGDIRNKPNLSQLQSWGTEMMMRFRDGQVSTNGDPFFG